LADGTEFGLQVQYAWCHRCETFVEAELLYSVQEIEEAITYYEASDPKKWEAVNVRRAALFREMGLPPPRRWTRERQVATWRKALAWRLARKSPPRCLNCGSFFAVKMLPGGREVPHPAGDGQVIVTAGNHAIGELPREVYFTGEGNRLAPLRYDYGDAYLLSVSVGPHREATLTVDLKHYPASRVGVCFDDLRNYDTVAAYLQRIRKDPQYHDVYLARFDAFHRGSEESSGADEARLFLHLDPYGAVQIHCQHLTET
jgi:hypothetical protein